MKEIFEARHRPRILLAFLVLVVLVRFSSAVMQRPGPDRSNIAIIQAMIPDPDVKAHAYLVRFIGASAPMLKQREWKERAPASLTKLMTAAIAEEELAPDAEVVFSGDAKNMPEKTSNAHAGEAFSRDDMIRFALMASDNDAAAALAQAVGRKEGGVGFADSVSRFVELMNEHARSLGLDSTHFVNPTGLDTDGHDASAEDLARISEYVYQAHRHLWEISRTADAVVYSKQGIRHEIKTTDELLYDFPGILGSKTGFTDRAEGALILLYPVRGHGTAIIVILGSSDRFGDGRRIITWLDERFGP